MKLLFLYFSGTGNTDWVARYLARKLGGLPVEIELRSIERQPAETLDDFDLLAVGFPIYGCDSPPLFQDYLARLALGQGRGAFAFCTKGAYAGGAVRHNLRRLARRRYLPLGGGSVTMPGSDGLALVGKSSWLARSALNKDFDHLKDADRLAGQIAGILSGLAAGQPLDAFRHPLRGSTTGNLFDRLWAYLYDLAGNYFRTRFWADERCAGCGLCARLCPVGNVELRNGHAHFAGHCVLCMRCIHQCPQEAIQIGKLTLDKFRWRGPRGAFKALRLRPEPEAHNHEQ